LTVLDAYAVLALLKGEPAAEPVGRLLRDDPDAALTPLGVAEVLDHLVRVEDAAEEEAALDLAQLGLADPPPLDAIVATRAGLLRARHHHRSRRARSPPARALSRRGNRRGRTAGQPRAGLERAVVNRQTPGGRPRLSDSRRADTESR